MLVSEPFLVFPPPPPSWRSTYEFQDADGGASADIYALSKAVSTLQWYVCIHCIVIGEPLPGEELHSNNNIAILGNSVSMYYSVFVAISN